MGRTEEPSKYNYLSDQPREQTASTHKRGRFERIAEKSSSTLYEIARRIKSVALDLISVVLLAATTPISLRAVCDPKRKDMYNPKLVDPKQPPILMIHGFLGSSSNWVYHRKGLADKGLKNLFTVDLGSPHHSIEHFAGVVKERIEEIKKITGRDDIILVCHSMGGLVADAYKKLYAKEAKTHILDTITIGTPLAGTRMAYLAAAFSVSVRQMIPSSNFSKERVMTHTRRFIDKNKTKIWEKIDIDKNGGKTIFRNEITRDHRITEIVQREHPKEKRITVDVTTRSSDGTIMVRHEEKPLEKDRTSAKTLHIGSKYDTIVPYKSSVSQAHDTGVKSEIAQKGAGGHVWQLFSRDIHETVYERIMNTIAEQKPEEF